MRKLRRNGLAVGLALLVLAVPLTAAAEPAQPSTLTVKDVSAFRDLSETGDMLVLVEYNIGYGTNPTEDVDETFLFTLRSGTTILGTNTAYPFQDQGYGEGVASIYLTEAEVTAASLGSWPFSGLTVRLEGNPSLFTDPPLATWSLSSGDYSTGSGQDTNQSQLATEVIAIAADLQTAWGLTLLLDEGNRLNAGNGSLYFQNAIPGLLQLAPASFSITTETPTFEDQTFTDTFANTSDARFDGESYLNPAFDSLADDLGLPRGSVQGLIVAIGIMGMGWLGRRYFGGGGGTLVGVMLGITVLLPLSMWGGFVSWAFGMTAIALIVLTAAFRFTREQL